ncbi:MAG TPA: helix-turn-helix domain-containing protein [Candidatus Nanoarchaeia archaeon]|nr:helix-turn-helix domain-containing protein [Candidatus Nanoarchaeia archaeon]
MDTSALEELGLSKGEVNVYLALLKLGETKVGSVIEKSGMASSAVHNSINSLWEKGIVSYIKKGKIKFYKCLPPKQLIDYLEDKKKRLLQIIPELDSLHHFSTEKQEAEIFEGIKGIMSMLNLLIDGTKRNEEYLFFSVKADNNKEIQEFFEMYDSKRKEKGLIVKGLAPKELKEFFDKRKLLKMKYTNAPLLSNVSICNDKIAIFAWEDKPVGYLIESKQLYNMFREFFYNLWGKSQ